METKRCKYCEKDLPIDRFYIDRQKKDGLRPRCKDCEKEYNIDKEKRREYEKNYWDSRREDKRKIVLKSYNKNKEKHKTKRKEYLLTENGKSKQKKHWQDRYAKMKNAFVESVNVKDLFNKYDGKCFYCGINLSFDNFHIDHYMPIAKGGMHEESNLRISCPHCNLSKGSKIPKEG